MTEGKLTHEAKRGSRDSEEEDLSALDLSEKHVQSLCDGVRDADQLVDAVMLALDTKQGVGVTRWSRLGLVADSWNLFGCTPLKEG